MKIKNNYGNGNIELNLFAHEKCNNTIKISYCYKELDNKV